MIRKAVINDSPRIAEIHVFSSRYAYKDFIPMENLINKMTVKNIEKSIRKYLSNNIKPFEMYVYEDNNIIKGFMTIGNCTDGDKDNNTFELENIYVDPLFQRQHIGTELIDYFIKTAVEKNKKEAVLWATEKNSNAIKFYDSMGFIPDGKKMRFELLNNEMCIRYWKSL
ncbi:MAG: GNAT family N-acetyltransferase [Treponema sp.]|jgi:ribosomal protein S18 acetylase RimI-like enzyme|nr:GNAT family N-acetyltransferase [Treponema sp.]